MTSITTHVWNPLILKTRPYNAGAKGLRTGLRPAVAPRAANVQTGLRYLSVSFNSMRRLVARAASSLPSAIG